MLRLAIVQLICDLCDIVRDFGYGVFFLVPMSNVDRVLSVQQEVEKNGALCFLWLKMTMCFRFPVTHFDVHGASWMFQLTSLVQAIRLQVKALAALASTRVETSSTLMLVK